MNFFLNYLKLNNVSMYNVLTDLNNNEVIKIVDFYSNLSFVTTEAKYGMIMNDIKNSITDVTLILNNGNIKAYKPILSLIPYFKGLFEDCEGDEVSIDASTQAMAIIVDAVYFSFIRLDLNNLLEVITLIDMFMYNQYLPTIIYFLYANGLNYIINNALKEQNVKRLLLIEMLLYHMFDNASTNDKMRINTMIQKEFKRCHQYMFNFTHWEDLFTQEEQLNHILLTKNYEMFNKTIIDPKLVLKSLIKALPMTDCYYDISNTVCYFNKEYINGPCTIIKSYYPQLEYISIKNFNYHSHHHNGENKLNIILHKSIPDVTIGTKILLFKDDQLINIKDYHYITAIYKQFDTHEIPTQRLTYLENITYQLILNKNIEVKDSYDSLVLKEVIVKVIV